MQMRWLSLAKERLKNRPDSEHEQTLFRILIAISVCIYFYVSGPQIALYIGLSYLPISVAILIWIICKPAVNRARRLIGIAGDIGMVSLGVVLANGEAAVIFAAIYLWIITGNGFRFGIRYLYFAMALSLIAFLLIMIFSPYWHHHIPLMIGQVILIAVIPLFMASLIRKLHRAIEAAEAANRIKSQFIANMSHELRTPLNGIIGMNDLSLSTGLSKEQQRFAYVIRESAYHLLGLIERILGMAKIDAGKLELVSEPFDLHQLLYGVVALFEGKAREKSISVDLQFDPEIPFRLIGDPKHIKQILINIVGNAVKFTEQGGVRVQVEAVEVSELQVWLRFTVTDSGIGMSESEQQTIFERFTQADATITRRFGGTGLGTTIAKELTELMGGSIHVESREGQGSKFTVLLPLKRQQEAAGPRDLSNVSVLLLGPQSDTSHTEQLLARWCVQVTRIKDEQLLLSSLMDAWSMGQPYDVAVIDRNVLKCKPELLARAVRDKSDLAGLDMILIDHKQERSGDPLLIAAGYASILHMPVQGTLLFNALHAASVVHHAADVISIADILQKKQATKQLNILLAEDNPVNQEVIGEILERAGYNPHIVSDGEQALDALAGDETFDLVLLDMNMPKVSGLEVLQQFRFMDTSATTPVLMLSADALPETIRACMAAGANDYLVKPVQMRELLDKVMQHASQKGEAGSDGDALPDRDGNSDLDESIVGELFDLINEPDKRRHLVAAFKTSAAEHLDAMDKLAKHTDRPGFLNRVHSLKGSAGTLGVQCIVSLCQEIEQHHTIDTRDMKTYAERLRDAYEVGCTALNRYINDL